MSEKIPYNDLDHVKYQADQLESNVKQRSYQRRILIKFIKLNRPRSSWIDMYLCKRSDSHLVEKCRDIISTMKTKVPT